jgi:hypothetical protein
MLSKVQSGGYLLRAVDSTDVFETKNHSKHLEDDDN